MPLQKTRNRRRALLRLLPWLVGALPVLGGLAIMHWQAQRELDARAFNSAQQAVAHLDQVLDDVAGAAKELLPLAGSPCAEVTLALRQQVTRRPFVRSTNLVHANHLYCSSLFGDFSEPVDPADYTNGSLWLMDGNSVTPGHPLLVYRASDGDKGAIATVDGSHLVSALRLIAPDIDLRLQVGAHWLDRQGKVGDAPVPGHAAANQVLASSRYAFSVHSGFAAGQAWRLMRSEYPVLFGLLLFLGTAAGAACYWQLRRASSPRAELQRALDADEFVPYFQPVVRHGDYRWSGAEVLMRWHHPREGLVRPDLFIPFAEHSGQIVPMTRRLMEKLASDLAPYADMFEDGFHLGVNITAAHCQDLSLCDDCQALLDAFPPGCLKLTLELTERTPITPSATTDALFESLRAMGVLLAIDDFGTGQSSLSYLRQFKVDYLKIDQSFVAMIGVDALSLHILDSIIELSGKLGLGMVAEGVETAEQRDYLARFGVDYQQGYLFGRPMPLDDFVKALAEQPRAREVAQPPVPLRS
ncbi:MAG: EAL domain-containing protein [Paucimonas sp.]|jgi:sensor c-di-GMP phosphodiesterase-like protein|nr:EAL domain-containing protein [Paucimonas sp.]